MIVKKALEEAQAAKENNIKSFIWKGAKEEVNGEKVQTEYRLVDCTEEQLRSFYQHCKSMLYNTDKAHPGRHVLLDIIKEQREKCNTELYLRYLEKGSEDRKAYPRFLYRNDISQVIELNKEKLTRDKLKELPISTLTSGIPSEFAGIPIELVMDGCLDALGKFNKQHITLTFILKQGLWFTPQEMKDLLEKDENGNTRDRLEVVRERLNLKSTANLYVNSRGLTYAQLRAMINLKSKKYFDLTTEQLTTLRDKVLFLLEEEVKYHIEQWETRMAQIEKVAEHYGYTL